MLRYAYQEQGAQRVQELAYFAKLGKFVRDVLRAYQVLKRTSRCLQGSAGKDAIGASKEARCGVIVRARLQQSQNLVKLSDSLKRKFITRVINGTHLLGRVQSIARNNQSFCCQQSQPGFEIEITAANGVREGGLRNQQGILVCPFTQ